MKSVWPLITVCQIEWMKKRLAGWWSTVLGVSVVDWHVEWQTEGGRPILDVDDTNRLTASTGIKGERRWKQSHLGRAPVFPIAFGHGSPISSVFQSRFPLREFPGLWPSIDAISLTSLVLWLPFFWTDQLLDLPSLQQADGPSGVCHLCSYKPT